MDQLAIFQHWFNQRLGADQATSHYLNQCWPDSLTHICGTRGRWVNSTLIRLMPHTFLTAPEVLHPRSSPCSPRAPCWIQPASRSPSWPWSPGLPPRPASHTWNIASLSFLENLKWFAISYHFSTLQKHRWLKYFLVEDPAYLSYSTPWQLMTERCWDAGHQQPCF